MATNAFKTPVLRATRSFAAQAAVSPKVTPLQTLDINTTVLPNKLVVASVENNSPITRVSVVFRAGSRFENSETIGASHVLRIAAGLKTKKSTQFGITRNIQQVGASLSATVDRETVSYTLESKRDAVDGSISFLSDVASRQVFRPWELQDNLPRLKYELAGIPDQVKVLELLHKAAFRKGLGNSLYCPDYMVGKHSTETLQYYVDKLFTTNRTAVVGVGIDHDSLLAYARNLELESGPGPEEAGKYYGGEVRLETSSPLAHVAVAVQGISLKDPKQVLTYGVLQYALGAGPQIKWGHGSSPLTKSVGDGVFAISALNISFSDTGLFGFTFSCPGEDAPKVLQGGLSVLKSMKIDSGDINRGKNLLKAAILFKGESAGELVTELGQQAALRGEALSPSKLASLVDTVTESDVRSAAKIVAGGTPSMAAIGQLNSLPYLDQIK